MKLLLLAASAVTLSLMDPAIAADPCLTMTPKSEIGDSCKPVPVTVQFKDCATGNATETFEAIARHECKSSPQKLKYWHKTSMLVSELEASTGGWGAKGLTVTKSYVHSNRKTAAAGPVASTAPAAVNVPVSPVVVAANTQEVKLAQASVTTPEVAAPAVTSAIHPTKFKFSGLLDVYYAYNTNNPEPVVPVASTAPASQNTYQIFNVYHNQFALALAKLTVQQTAEPLGFRIDLGFGPAAETVAGTGADVSTRNLMQGYVSYKTASGLTIDAGKFVTHMGYEVIEAQDNANYSRSLMFGYLIPFWHSGVRLNYAWSPTVSTTFFVLNGWGNHYENNKDKTLGAQVNWTVADGYGLILNYIGGNESNSAPAATATQDNTQVIEGIFTAQVSPNWKLALNYDSFTRTVASVNTKANSLAAYATWSVNDTNSLSLRYELFDDTDGTILTAGTVQKVNSATLTWEQRCIEGLKMRYEIRQDTSDKDVFTKVDGATSSAVKSQSEAMVSALFSF